MKARTARGEPALPSQLDCATREQNQYEPRSGRGRGDPRGERVDEDAGPLRVRGASPDRPGDAQPGPDGNGGNGGPGSHSGTPDPGGRRSGEEQPREREDQHEAGQDEAKAPDDGSPGAAQPPGAVDRQLRGCRPGQDVGCCDRPLELVVGQPFPPRYAQLTEQRDMRGRAAEPDAPDAAPLPRDGAYRYAGSRWWGGYHSGWWAAHFRVSSASGEWMRRAM
jgi:hypothetical protein